MDTPEFYIPAATLRRVGIAAIALIQRRTLEGKDADGKAFAPYGTRPFAMPSGGLTQRAKQNLESTGQLQYFTTKKGALWLIVKGGYRAAKAAGYPQHGGVVNLSATGGMLRSMIVTGVREQLGEVTIGFTRQDTAELALYHNELGAGRSRVIRKFFGLSNRERGLLGAMVGADVQVR